LAGQSRVRYEGADRLSRHLAEAPPRSAQLNHRAGSEQAKSNVWKLRPAALRGSRHGKPKRSDPRESCHGLAALPTLHKDPFDRILIAQAVAEGVFLATNDEPISDYPVRTIW
jgi:hypothetical protein